MANLLKQLRQVLGSQPLLVGDVVSVSGGVAVVQLPGGATITARGSASVSDRVFVRGGAIEGLAPALSLSTIDL